MSDISLLGIRGRLYLLERWPYLEDYFIGLLLFSPFGKQSNGQRDESFEVNSVDQMR